jgi:hypothetical protein
MNESKTGFDPRSATGRAWIPVLIAVIFSALLLMQWRWRVQERRERNQAASHLSGLKLENRSLARQLPGPDVVADLRADREALVRLRAEVEELRKKMPTTVAPKAVIPSQAKQPVTMREAFVAPAHWRNRGRSTAADAVETTLWAAAGGDVVLLQECLVLDAGAKTRAKALFDRLPPEQRARYVSPERLVAFMTAVGVPLGAAQIRTAKEDVRAVEASPKVQLVQVSVSTMSGAGRTLEIATRKSDYGWKLVVPEEAVARFELELTGITRGRGARPKS